MASMTSLAIELVIASQDSDLPDLPKRSPYKLKQGQPSP
jgi:hypothetical protein